MIRFSTFSGAETKAVAMRAAWAETAGFSATPLRMMLSLTASALTWLPGIIRFSVS